MPDYVFPKENALERQNRINWYTMAYDPVKRFIDECYLELAKEAEQQARTQL